MNSKRVNCRLLVVCCFVCLLVNRSNVSYGCDRCAIAFRVIIYNRVVVAIIIWDANMVPA